MRGRAAGRRDTRPLYVRVLRLRNVSPGGLLCFAYFEGMIGLGALLALAELVSWWAVPILPLGVAAMVKVNDLVVGASRAVPAAVPGVPVPVAVPVTARSAGSAARRPAGTPTRTLRRPVSAAWALGEPGAVPEETGVYRRPPAAQHGPPLGVLPRGQRPTRENGIPRGREGLRGRGNTNQGRFDCPA